jgi:hypothetical protein
VPSGRWISWSLPGDGPPGSVPVIAAGCETRIVVVADCLVVPPELVVEAPGALRAAMEALDGGDQATARQLVAEIDRRALWGYWFRTGLEWTTRHRPAAHPPSVTRLDAPSPATTRMVFNRDGWRCRYCGLRVVDRWALKLLSQALPDTFPWGNRNGNSHPATVVLAATPDHVNPRSQGGGHDLENLVTSCGTCQYQAKGACTLDELGLADPRGRQPVVDDWDGLVTSVSAASFEVDRDQKGPDFDPEIEYLIAAARDGHYLPSIKDPLLLDKVATIFEATVNGRPPPHL